MRLARVLVRADVVRVGLEVRVLRGRGAEVLQQLLRAGRVLRLARHQEAVDRRVERVLPVRRVDLRVREEVEVGVVGGVRRLLADERAEQVHAGLLLDELLRAFLPRQSERALRVVRQELAPLVEDGLDLRAVPRLLAAHQPDVEVVAVDAHVQDVERAHRRPPVLVGERDRREPVLLHLLREGDELVPRLRDLVPVLLEHALAVEDRPRVVVDRHEVVVAVEALRRLLQRRRELRLERIPHVVDRRQQSLLREELHAVAGEPGEDVLRLALQVRVDLLLERVVVDGVDAELRPRLLTECLEHRGVRGLRDRIGRVGADRDGARQLRQPGGWHRAARPRGGQAVDGSEPARARRCEQTAPRQLPSRELFRLEHQRGFVRHESLLGLGHTIAEQHTIEQE